MRISSEHLEVRARQDFERALRQAARRQLSQRIWPRCNDLMPAAPVFGALELGHRKNLGVQRVALDRIVGSTGRTQDFDLAFLPRHRGLEGRWTSLASARRQGLPLPAVLLYQVGQAYFVEDGHHRVSVARAADLQEISARVIEIDPSPLIPARACQRLGFKIPGKAHACSR